MIRAEDPYSYLSKLNKIQKFNLFLQEDLKEISLLSESLKNHIEHNRSILDQAINLSALRSSVLDDIKLSSLSEFSKTLVSRSDLAAADNISKKISSMQQVLVDNISKNISKFLASSQISLSHLALESFEVNTFKIQPFIHETLRDTFIDFSKSYAKLFASFSDNPASVISLPSIISQYSSVEFSNGVRVAKSVTVESCKSEQCFDLEEETHQLEEYIQQKPKDILEELLGELSMELITPLYGARQSLESTNPDRIRHCATSLRELFTHVLNTLSPDLVMSYELLIIVYHFR